MWSGQKNPSLSWCSTPGKSRDVNPWFSGRTFAYPPLKHILIWKKSMVNKKNNPLIVLGWNRKVRPSPSPFAILRQASWCQTVILGTEFSIAASHSWLILVICPSASLCMSSSESDTFSYLESFTASTLSQWENNMNGNVIWERFSFACRAKCWSVI